MDLQGIAREQYSHQQGSKAEMEQHQLDWSSSSCIHYETPPFVCFLWIWSYVAMKVALHKRSLALCLYSGQESRQGAGLPVWRMGILMLLDSKLVFILVVGFWVTKGSAVLVSLGLRDSGKLESSS